MRLHVRRKSTLPREALATLRTRKGKLTRMRSHVRFEGAGPWKVFAARFTLEGRLELTIIGLALFLVLCILLALACAFALSLRLPIALGLRFSGAVCVCDRGHVSGAKVATRWVPAAAPAGIPRVCSKDTTRMGAQAQHAKHCRARDQR
jgi:hypothetical protein